MLIDARKLNGSLSMSQDYPVPKDSVLLHVPFDLGNWQVHDLIAGAETGAKTDSSEYAQGEGSRCSNADSGMEVFKGALKTAALPSEDVSVLISARTALVADCNKKSTDVWKTPVGLHSTLGREFATYIAGANAFYAGDFAAAIKEFKALRNSANPWLKETSRYMVGRTLLNSAQRTAFGEWGELQRDHVDKDNLKEAEQAFDAYLQDYPNGDFAASARGLLRRVDWLGGNQTKLAEAYDKAFMDSSKGNVTLSELVQEIDAKLIAAVDSNQIQSPQLLAIVDLMRMREQADKGVLTLAELERQKDRFAGKPALYGYLLAAFHLYVDGKPELALALLPSAPDAQLSYFVFSQQTLRVLALEASRRSDEARRLVLRMLPLAKLPLQHEQLELELAAIEERTGHVDRVFAPESPIQDKAIRTILVEHSASAELLRQRIKDAKENPDVVDASLYVLLYKELTGGKYQAFQKDLALAPPHPSEFLAAFVAMNAGRGEGYQCPSLREVALTLQSHEDDGKSLNCLGEFVRLHGVHYDQDATPPMTDLGGGHSSFPATMYSRMDSYLKVIGNSHADGDARAYALSRAVRCYEPAGYNECGKQDIPPRIRKQWFQTLHKEYPDSVWAKSLRYYW
jgi:hypothetical protein